MEGGGGGYTESLALIGFMGAGKSEVGGLLASILKMDFVDLDEVIARSAGKSVSEIFASEGEGSFRERECEALLEVLAGKGKVISCGGGIVLRDSNVELLRDRCRVFFLRVSSTQVVERLSGGGDRPLLAGGDLKKEVNSLMTERAQRYSEAAHEEVDVGNSRPRELAEEIAQRWY
jgi:shikimate kinase